MSEVSETLSKVPKFTLFFSENLKYTSKAKLSAKGERLGNINGI